MGSRLTNAVVHRPDLCDVYALENADGTTSSPHPIPGRSATRYVHGFATRAW
jgi:hypothetical protein